MEEYTIQDVLTENEGGYMFVDFPLKEGKADYILVNNSGIFVIKEQNVKKFLTGKTENDYFYEYKDKKKKKPYPNPVKANDAICREIFELIDEVSIYMVNCVIFLNDNCDLIESDNVFNLEELDELLCSFDSVYSDKEVEYITETLEKVLEARDK